LSWAVEKGLVVRYIIKDCKTRKGVGFCGGVTSIINTTRQNFSVPICALINFVLKKIIFLHISSEIKQV